MPLALSVNGAVHPELIPDDLAYRLFLRGIAFKSNLSDAEKAHREAKIKRLGLTPADHDLLIAALSGVRETLDVAFAVLNSSTTDSVAVALRQRSTAP